MHSDLNSAPLWLHVLSQVIEAVLNNPSDKTQLSLVYGNVSEGDIILKSRVDDLAAKHPDQFKVRRATYDCPHESPVIVALVYIPIDLNTLNMVLSCLPLLAWLKGHVPYYTPLCSSSGVLCGGQGPMVLEGRRRLHHQGHGRRREREGGLVHLLRDQP